MFVTRAGRTRYLRAIVRPGPITVDLVARIGHELFHALEIARVADVVDPKTLAWFYQSLNQRSREPGSFETPEALDAQWVVAGELTASDDPVKRVAQMAHLTSPHR